MWDRLQRSWTLVKASAAVVAENKRLLLLPAASAVASAIVIATFAVPILAALGTGNEAAGAEREGVFFLWMFLLYVLLYFVTIFFNTALVSVALARLDGREAGLRDGLARAVARLPAIAGYAVIAATVGVVLRAIEERVGFIGRLVVGLIGAVWTLATFLVVPILAAQDAGPLAAVRGSGELFKRTWGENVAANVGMALVFTLGYLAIIASTLAAVALASNFELDGIGAALGVVGVIAVLALAAGQATLQGVYSAALYRYASHGAASAGFDEKTIAAAFGPKN